MHSAVSSRATGTLLKRLDGSMASNNPDGWALEKAVLTDAVDFEGRLDVLLEVKTGICDQL